MKHWEGPLETAGLLLLAQPSPHFRRSPRRPWSLGRL